MKFRFKPFQARLVACWLLAMPLAWGMIASEQHKIAKLKAKQLAEAIKELNQAQKLSFVNMFWVILVTLIIVSFLIEFIAKLSRSTTVYTITGPIKDG